MSDNPFDFLIPLEEDQDRWDWATVEGVGPLRVRFDGETIVQDATPDVLVARLFVGDRVRVHRSGLRMIVVGRAGGQRELPPPEDTGWVDLTSYMIGGFVAEWAVGRRVGVHRVIQIGTTGDGAAVTQGAAINVTGALPVVWRPTKNAQGAAWLTAGYTGTAYIRSNGTIAVAHQSGATRATAQFTISYMV